MSRSNLSISFLLLGALLASSPAIGGSSLEGFRFLLASPTLIDSTDQLFDANAQYGIAVLDVGGATSFQDLGGVEAASDGSSVFLAINGDRVVAGAPRMIKLPPANVNYVSGGSKDGLVQSAESTPTGPNYVTNSMLSTLSATNPRDQSDGYILGMTVDQTTTDLYAAVNGGADGPSIVRIANGAVQAAAVIEFANPATANPLFPNFTPDFADVLMGPQAIAFYRQPSATNLFYFADGTPSDFCIGWAVQDLSNVRTAPSPGVVQTTAAADNDLFTDEMRVHAPVFAGDYSFNPASPTIHGDIVYIPIAARMAAITGRSSGVVLVDDLNDHTESSGSDPDVPELTPVLNSRNPTALCNVFTITGQYNANTDILLADYTGTDTRLVKVTFGVGGTVVSQTVLDLSTPGDLIPGRVSELAMDSNGSIYAVVGADPDLGGGQGVVYVVAPTQSQTGPTPTPTPAPNFACFETDAQSFGSSGRFTLPTLTDYARNVRLNTDVITELRLIQNGDLENYLPSGASSPLRFFYINRPITITELDRLTIQPGPFGIFRSDGVLRSFLHVNGRLISPLQGAPIGTSFGQPIIGGGVRDVTASLTDPVVQYYGHGTGDEAQIRYTSVVGFISWLKQQGVPDFAALNWSAPGGDAAAAAFQSFVTRNVGTELAPIPLFDAVSPDPETVVNDMEQAVYGPGTGRWGGIYFNNPDVGSSSAEASSVSYSRVEFAEVGVYALDSEMSSNNLRDANALRIVGSMFSHNLIGLSIEGMSPLVARCTIVRSTPSEDFDLRSPGTNPRPSPCGLPPSQRFANGVSGTGVYIAIRGGGSASVDMEPLFWGNVIAHNVGNGVQIQQPGVGIISGSGPNLNNQPRPLFGRADPPVETAHEYSNVGYNSFFGNGTGGASTETFQNFVYNVEEVPADFGEADPNHDQDLSAEMNYWGNFLLGALESDIRDGKDLANLGEVITRSYLFAFPSSVDGSTELYE